MRFAAFKSEKIVEQVVDHRTAQIAYTRSQRGGYTEYFDSCSQHDILNGGAAYADGGEADKLTRQRHDYSFRTFRGRYFLTNPDIFMVKVYSFFKLSIILIQRNHDAVGDFTQKIA